MLVVDGLINVSMYTHRAAVWRLSSKAAFLKLRVSFLPSVMPILMVIHRTTKTVINNKLPKRWAIIALHSCVKLFQVVI